LVVMSGTLICKENCRGVWSICKRVQRESRPKGWGLATSSSTELMNGVVCMLHNADWPCGHL
jgi:hypothetical protein